MISKETEADILRLFHAEKWPVGTIARQLGIHHTTVQRVLQQTGVEIATVTPRPSLADPFLPFIVEQLEKYSGLRASRLFQMVKERGYQGGPDHFRRVVGRYRPRKPAEAFQRLKTLPGEQVTLSAQISARQRSPEHGPREGKAAAPSRSLTIKSRGGDLLVCEDKGGVDCIVSCWGTFGFSSYC